MLANIAAFERNLAGVYITATPSPGEGTIELLGGGVGDRVEIAESDMDSESVGTPVSIEERGKSAEVSELPVTSATISSGVLPKGCLRLLRDVNELVDALLPNFASRDMDLR